MAIIRQFSSGHRTDVEVEFRSSCAVDFGVDLEAEDEVLVDPCVTAISFFCIFRHPVRRATIYT